MRKMSELKKERHQNATHVKRESILKKNRIIKEHAAKQTSIDRKAAMETVKKTRAVLSSKPIVYLTK